MIKGVCENYYEHEEERKDRQIAAEMAIRAAEYRYRMQNEQDQEAARKWQYDQSWQTGRPGSQRNVEAYGFPAPTYSGQQFAPPRWPDPQAPGPSVPR